MPRLTIPNLYKLFDACTIKRGGDESVLVKSLHDPLHSWKFSVHMLTENRVKIASLLSQLPRNMLQSASGKGQPWIYALRLRGGRKWGDLNDVDKLMALARAAGMVKVYAPLEVCDIPYCIILDDEVRYLEYLMPEDQRNPSLLYWNFSFIDNESN